MRIEGALGDSAVYAGPGGPSCVAPLQRGPPRARSVWLQGGWFNRPGPSIPGSEGSGPIRRRLAASDRSIVRIPGAAERRFRTLSIETRQAPSLLVSEELRP